MNQPDINQRTHKLLSSHGFGFQDAVLRVAQERQEAGESHWVFEAAEIPVENQGKITHVEFALRTKDWSVVQVGECKRADPSRASWVFTMAPYIQRGGHPRELIFERLGRPGGRTREGRVGVVLNNVTSDKPVYRRGFTVKTGARGEMPSRKNPINEAVTQVLRSMNGLIDHAASASGIMAGIDASRTENCLFMPVIYTTAELWVTDVDLSESSLADGNAPPVQGMEKVPYLWFVHNQSPALRHSVAVNAPRAKGFSEYVRFECARAIRIVSASDGGVENFLKHDLDSWLN